MHRRTLLSNGILGTFSLPFVAATPTINMAQPSLEDVLLQRYPGIRRNIRTSIYEKMKEEDLRTMPHGMNSIAWNIWHMARAEDVGMNRLVSEGEQVFDRDGYKEKLNLSIRHFGTGMSSEEVQELSETIDLAALKAYHEAVGEQTLKVFQQLDELPLDSHIAVSHLDQVLIKEGALHQNALWVKDFYETKIRSWFLVHMSLTHNFEHLGQIMLLRKLLGYTGTR